MSQTVFPIFKKCVEAIREGVLIRQVSSTDKEFHFQNWFEDRLKETGFNYEIGGRNSYPDFRIVSVTEGYELKGLAYPGRDASFDSNSQVQQDFIMAEVFTMFLVGTQKDLMETNILC